MNLREKKIRNYLTILPSKSEFKTSLKNTDGLLNEIKSAEVKIEDEKLLMFYKKLIFFIERNFIDEEGNFEINRYSELRNNLTYIDEEFIKQYGDNILSYIKKDKENLIKDIENLDTKFNFSVRNQKIKKTITENGNIKEIYVIEKRPIKEYDFILYITDILSSMQHLICIEIENNLEYINTGKEFYEYYSKNKYNICSNIIDSIETTYQFLKDTNATIFNDLYEYYINNLDTKIAFVLRSTIQIAKFRFIDIYEDYACQRNLKQKFKKIKEEKRNR